MTTLATNPHSYHLHVQISEPNSNLPPSPRDLVCETPRFYRPSDRHYQLSNTSPTTESNRAPWSSHSSGGRSYKPHQPAPDSTSSSPEFPNRFDRTKPTQGQHEGGKRRKSSRVVISSDDEDNDFEEASPSPTKQAGNRRTTKWSPGDS